MKDFLYDIEQLVWVYGRDGYEQARITERFKSHYGLNRYFVEAESFKGPVSEGEIRK